MPTTSCTVVRNDNNRESTLEWVQILSDRLLSSTPDSRLALPFRGPSPSVLLNPVGTVALFRTLKSDCQGVFFGLRIFW